MESIRSLRTSLQFTFIDTAKNIVCLASPSFGVGKSFVSANLAHALADTGKRTLLVDADMRRGHLHQLFSTERRKGLSEALGGELDIGEAVRETQIDNLYFLTSGTAPSNPSELLMGDRFETIMDTVSGQYDVVIVDTPPLLAVTDAAIVGRVAGITLIILRSGHHPMQEIEEAVKRLKQNGVSPYGFVFNQVPLRTATYRKYGYHYQYEYK
jgi:tyrosine-protein kinase Etk/Wzc